MRVSQPSAVGRSERPASRIETAVPTSRTESARCAHRTRTSSAITRVVYRMRAPALSRTRSSYTVQRMRRAATLSALAALALLLAGAPGACAPRAPARPLPGRLARRLGGLPRHGGRVRLPRGAVIRAVFLDAGNTLLRMNYAAIAAELARHGVRATPDAV